MQAYKGGILPLWTPCGVIHPLDLWLRLRTPEGRALWIAGAPQQPEPSGTIKKL
jgi:hypothetical protein